MVVAERPQTREEITQDIPQLRGFDDFVRKIMRDWKVQGIGVAIAKDGELIYARGFGLRDVEKALLFTPHTICPIGSTTKTFTSAALAALVDDGLLDWDTPVREFLPAFKLWDQFATDRMTPRDLLCHRSGLPRHDLMWYGSSRNRQEMFDRLQYLQPNADFRTIWQYQNLMYMTAGHLVKVLSGQSWEEFVQKRFFDSLGMASSKVTPTAVQEAPDFSIGYRRKANKVTEIPFYMEIEAMAPAGSIVSNITDMGQWLKVHLGGGKLGDQQCISEAQIRQMHSPQMVIARGRRAETPYASYGLGWFVEPYRGHDMIHHGGNIDGFSAMFSLLPADGVGVVVLTNMDGTPANTIIPYNVFDRFIGGAQVPWNTRFKADWKEVQGAAKRGKGKTREDRVPRTRPSHPLAAYVGTYAHPGYGDVRIELNDNKLTVRYNNLEFPVRHYHYDTFEMTFERFDFSFQLAFITDRRGIVQSFSAPLEPSVADIVFTRVADESMTDPSFLAAFAGDYEVLGAVVTVLLKGSALRISLPGQPEHELTPIKGTEFGLKDLSGFGIEFKRDASGAVTEALLNQMGAVFSAKKR